MLSEMKKIKVLGVGSPFGDDQVGWKVLDNLQALQFSRLISFKKLDRPHLQLLDEIKQDDSLIYIIDAMKSNASIGEIKRLSLDEISSIEQPISTHDLGVIPSLQIAAALNQLPKQLILFGVEIGEVNKDDKISEAVLGAVLVVSEIIKSELMKSFYA